MKIIIAMCALVAVTCAEIASPNKYEFHHTEHEKSVAAARQLAQERLAKLEGSRGYSYGGAQLGNAYGASGSEKYVHGCSSCNGGSENVVSYNSRQSSSSQRSSTSAGHGLSSSDYTGVGIVGRVDDADEDVQNIVAPNYASIGSSRYYSSATEADDMQQRVAPHDLSHVSSSAYRSSAAQHEESELQKNIGSGHSGDGLRSYSQQRYGEADDDDVQRSVSSGYIGGGGSQRSYSQGSESSRTVSQVIPTYVIPASGSSLRSAASQTESELNESRRPVYSGQHVRISARPGSSNVIAVPVRVIQTTGVQSTDDQGHVQSRTSEYSSGSEASSSRVQHPISTTYRVVYNPTRNYVTSDKIASASDSESSRTVNSIPTADKLTNYNSFNQQSGSQSRFNAEEEGDTQVRVIPGRVSYPSNGGSSRTASTGTSGSNYYQQRVAVAPITASEASSTSSRTAEEREERRYTPSVPTYITNSRVASANQDESRIQGGSVAGTYVIPVASQTRYQTNQQAGSGSQSQYQSGASFSPYVPSHSYSGVSSADRLSSRFGTGVSGVQTGDLQTFMSESERLARLQQQQIAGSSSGGSLSTYDANRRTVQNAANLDSAAANFVRTSNLASRTSEFDTASVDGGAARVGAGNGGFHNVRSWNKQSKWSSGSEYGPDGKPKTYSTLSTAEGEKFNVNGAEAGYKAATTTLENDGKVSTYSIRTP